MAVSQACEIAAPGAEKKFPHACSTFVLVNAFSRPPITIAVKMARKVTVTVLPSSIDSLRVWPNEPWCVRRSRACSPHWPAPGAPARSLPNSWWRSSWWRCSWSGCRRGGSRVSPGFPCPWSPGLARPRRLPGHQQAEFLHGHGWRPEAGYPAVVHDRDPVRKRVDLVELGRDDEHGDAVVALLHDALVHELDRTDVKPSGRLAGHQQLVFAAEFPGQDDLLLVAPDNVPTAVSADVVRTSNSCTRSAALSAMAPRLRLMPDANGGLL